MNDKRIIIFNHKGGVSKTTTTYHLGWKLTTFNKRVLLVDADSQCNLTGLILKDKFDDYYYNPKTKKHNLKDGVEPAFNGSPEPIKAIDCYQIPRNKNLFLLPGHPNITELEPSLSLAQNAVNTFTVLQNLPGSFNALIEKVVEKYQIDIILFDLNPSLSAINQNFFSISDIFIIPTNPDPFSLMALKTLSEIIPRWNNKKKELVSFFKDATYPFPNRKLYFGGIITQRFNIRNGLPAKPFRDNMNEILEFTKKEFYPKLYNNGLAFSYEIYQKVGINEYLEIIEIPDFQMLGQQANKYGIPVFSLTGKEIGKQGTVQKNMLNKQVFFNKIFEEFATKINKLLEFLDNE